ncbi:MAG TPA: Sec-independent protein translocase protein TatB [Alphaproteobacteria bacterium]|nr:Sec-independent protein translocase protein TatB [Alphaproteobacteria bacterium]
MFDLSWSEILVIGTAAIIFIGPKELPGALRTAGQWMAKARSLAREFQNSVDDMIRESELEKIKSEVDKLGSTDLQKHIETAVDPEGEINKALTAPAISLDEPAAAGPAVPPVPAASTPAEPPAAADAGAPHKPAA